MDPELVKQRKRIAELFTKHVRKTISHEEQVELQKWIGDREDRKQIFTILTSQSQDTMAKALKSYTELINGILGQLKK